MRKFLLEVAVDKVIKGNFSTEEAATEYVRKNFNTDGNKEIELNAYDRTTKVYLGSYDWSKRAQSFITGRDSNFSLSELKEDKNLESMTQKGFSNFYESKKDVKGAKAEVMQVMFEALKEKGYKVFGSNETNQDNWTMVIKHPLTDLKFTVTAPLYNGTYYSPIGSRR